MVGIKHNGIIITVEKWETHKNPVLAVRLNGENRVYKVASFNSEETAHWFEEIAEEFFMGLATKEGEG